MQTTAHFHVLDGAGRFLYGTYADHATAARVMRRIHQAEDIDAWVYGACHPCRCSYGGPDGSDRPADRIGPGNRRAAIR